MKKRILFVEDDKEMRSWVKELLETRGYEMLEAGNAKDGILMAVKEKPDLILMDIRLPLKKRGIGTARILRKKEETRDIPIIFVTAYERFEHARELKNIPNCGFITKPVRVRTFLEEIEKHIA